MPLLYTGIHINSGGRKHCLTMIITIIADVVISVIYREFRKIFVTGPNLRVCSKDHC
jgi:hypothetical protein